MVGIWLDRSAILFSMVFLCTQTFVIKIASQHRLSAKLHTSNHEILRSSPSPAPIPGGKVEKKVWDVELGISRDEEVKSVNKLCEA